MPAYQTATWNPGWYELDQTLLLGERQKLWFFQDPPPSETEAVESQSTPDFVFFNQLDSTTNCQVRFAKVVEMVHPTLGPLSKIDTDGCDYIFFPVDGEEVVVNAEEDPGNTYDEKLDIDQWMVFVKLEDVSQPVVDVV